MGLIDWRTGIFLLALGALGLLLPGIEGFAPARWDLPAWPFWVLLTAGAALTALGLYNKFKKPR
ncbi:MAG TPA: hypothetical protein ENN88_04745 [Candidatus Coatesbacteria bacterium]|nr:hypothetical protein [Candidatus Coatesbacteria bacterium]